jgi:protein TonB
MSRRRRRSTKKPAMTELLIDRPLVRLPSRRTGGTIVQWCASALIHVIALAAIVVAVAVSRVSRSDPPASRSVTGAAAVDAVHVTLPRIVFRLPRGPNGGGGGGGNRDRGPIRQATAPGRDQATLRTRQRVQTAGTDAPEIVDRVPAVLLEARSLASGDSVQGGLPSGGVSFGTSQGSGSGGGVGTGSGSGIGPGEGPGVGPGSGGGIGGGTYKVGNGVTVPRLLRQVDPRYTQDALERRIQGTVSLDVVVGRDGVPSRIRVVGSLDSGLDQEAISALRRWRFSPGTLAGSPVDVEVVVVMEFWIR